ncbi:hypothetical protein AVEN_238071-1, partial [Araneus ventricosus]
IGNQQIRRSECAAVGDSQRKCQNGNCAAEGTSLVPRKQTTSSKTVVEWHLSCPLKLFIPTLDGVLTWRLIISIFLMKTSLNCYNWFAFVEPETCRLLHRSHFDTCVGFSCCS